MRAASHPWTEVVMDQPIKMIDIKWMRPHYPKVYFARFHLIF